MKLDFDKGNGLIPVIVQHTNTSQVLMLGYMNEEALKLTRESGKVTFFSRSKNRLWVKGEVTGHTLLWNDIKQDCDGDTLLIQAIPTGPTCHTGAATCFQDESAKGFIYELENIIAQRIDRRAEHSYTTALFSQGMNKIAQKVGEEAVELLIEAKDDNILLFKNEAADLLYHFLILLKAKEVDLQQIEEILKKRKA